MSSSESVRVRLAIRASHPMTEVRVSDARFRTIDLPANAGTVDVDLSPGIYEVAFRQERGWHNQLVVLRPDEPVEIHEPADSSARAAQPDADDADDSDFATPVGAQAHLRVQLSRSVSGEPGLGDMELPFGVVDVRIRRGVLDPANASVPVPRTSSRQRNATVEAGCWFLSVNADNEEGADGVELPVVCSPGWQTRVRVYFDGSNGSLVWDPSRTLISLRRPDGDRHARGSENRAALVALASRRSLAGDSFHGMVRELLGQKSGDPMRGLYAGHLMACATPADRALLMEVAANLSELLGHGGGFRHPDVEALRLRARLMDAEDRLDDVTPFDFPPMMAASWDVLLDACRRRPEVVPRGSLTADFAGRSFLSGPWRCWTPQPVVTPADMPQAAPGMRAAFQEEAAFPDAAEADIGLRALRPGEPAAPGAKRCFDDPLAVIRKGLSLRSMREWFRLRHKTDVTASGASETGFDATERALVSALRPVAADEERQAVFDAAQLTARRGEHRPLDAGAIAAQIGLPIATVEDAADRLALKFDNQARIAGLPDLERSAMARPKLLIPYDPAFLGDGFTVPIPTLGDTLKAAAFAGGVEVPYTHFSLVMHERRRVALVAANNIDAAHKVQVAGGHKWSMDERLGDTQLGPEVYGDNQLDRGHLVRREDVLWGSVNEARLANEATFFYSNAAPQHQNFNQDEWVTLEDWVLDRATDFSYRLCVLTGPVLRDDDPILQDLPPNLRVAYRANGPAQIPAAFWKVIALRDASAGGEDLSVVAFAMRQTEMWNDRQGRRLLNLKVHQVTLQAISEWTGLDFGDLAMADELQWSPERARLREIGAEPEWPQIRSAQDIVFSGADRRLRGMRIARTRSAAPHETNRMRVESGLAEPCCGRGANADSAFDARGAIEALNRDVVRLTALLAAREGHAPALADRALATDAGAPVPAGERTLPDVANRDADAEEHREVLAATPADRREAMARFLEWAATQRNVARGTRAPTDVRDLERIVGGSDVVPGGFLSCVCIGTAARWQCTGAVVAPRVVLTAAHCGTAISRIMVGGNVVQPLDGAGRIVSVRKVVVHPSYRSGENDITVLILAEDAEVPPVKIATEEQLRAATNVQLVGFGFNDPSRQVGFGTKRQVVVPMAPVMGLAGDPGLQALEQLLGFHAAYEFVAGRKGLGLDTCNGDSGGPAYILGPQNFLLAGLTSRATRQANLPCGDGGIYVRPDRFRDWIAGVLSEAGLPAL